MNDRLLGSLFKLGAKCFLPSGRRGRLSILIFHGVSSGEDGWRPGTITAQEFDAIMAFVAECFFVLPLEEAVDRLSAARLPPRTIAITFDDGYRNNLDVALPILLKYGLSATFFIATGALRDGIMWNDRVIEALQTTQHRALDLTDLQLGELDLRTDEARKAACRRSIKALKYLPPERRTESVARLVDRAGVVLDRRLMLDESELVRLAEAGMSIGAHTVSHPILTRLSDEAAEQEIVQSKKELVSILGREISLFAYPNGRPGADYSRAHVEIVRRAGFRAAVSTSPGVSARETDPYQLPRFTPWDRSPLRFGLRLLQNGLRTSAAV